MEEGREEESSSPIWTLPPELLVLILSDLDTRALLQISFTCSYLFDLAQLPEVWASIIPRELNYDNTDEEEISSLLQVIGQQFPQPAENIPLPPLPRNESENTIGYGIGEIDEEQPAKVSSLIKMKERLRVFGVGRQPRVTRNIQQRRQPSSTLLPLVHLPSEQGRKRIGHFPPINKMLFFSPPLSEMETPVITSPVLGKRLVIFMTGIINISQK